VIEDENKQWLLSAYIGNVQILFDPPWLNLRENLRIRRILKEEQREFYPKNFEGFDRRIEDLSCVIERQVSFKKTIWDSPDYRQARADLQTVFQALLLFVDRLARQYTLIETGQGFREISESLESYAPLSDIALWAEDVAFHHQRPLVLDCDDEEEFKKVWERLDKLQCQASHLDMSLDRFAMASQAAGESYYRMHRLVDYVSSMEALLTQNQPELSFKLPLRMATLIGRSPRECQDVFDFMREVYDVRSKIVHGDDPRKFLPLKVREVEIDFEEVLGRVHSYSRRSIRFVIDLIDAGFKKKEELLDLVDLATLRSDMRNSMMSFLDSGKDGEQLHNQFKGLEKARFYDRLITEQFDESKQKTLRAMPN